MFAKSEQKKTEMPLKQFVEETLTEIVSAVLETKEKLNAKAPGVIAPELPWDMNTYDKLLRHVEYDITISLEETKASGTEGKIGVGVHVIDLASSGKSSGEKTTGNINRIKFSVPVNFSAAKTIQSK